MLAVMFVMVLYFQEDEEVREIGILKIKQIVKPGR